MELRERIEKSTDFIRENSGFEPETGIVLGTGLGSLADYIDKEAVIDYKGIPEFPVSTVLGHEGRLILGRLEGKKVIAMQGRFHYYEGYTMQEVTIPVRVMKQLGIKLLVASNACGGLNPNFAAGDIMIITDHINFMGTNPLIGPNLEEFGPRFPDMSQVYDKELVELLEKIAASQGIRVHKGVYGAVSGPNYCTKAELSMMIKLGADTVGMSTVPETIAARHCGLKVAGVSCITDMAIPDTMTAPSHEEIVKVAESVKPRFVSLVKQFIKEVRL
ncbi:MAG TPA: purine-nucleoside phosphorylase [Bacillota bacterium]|nr:purine-nucleoside phosphorylase [Bacillota bacterium]HQO42278.1 purine-nucleoside phosphorylase [Bacillota bacterium]HQQ44070.1 purine-nucleoside phosphorylase [Bacillota bacterium]